MEPGIVRVAKGHSRNSMKRVHREDAAHGELCLHDGMVSFSSFDGYGVVHPWCMVYSSSCMVGFLHLGGSLLC